MIRVDEALCAGCAVCVDECPVGAITLVAGSATVDATLCDSCGSFDEPYSGPCVLVCPNGALTCVAEAVPGAASEPSSLTVYKRPVKALSVNTRQRVPWQRPLGRLHRTDFGKLRRTALPAVGGALSWVGREVMPRLAPLALEILDGVIDRQLSLWSREGVPPVSAKEQGWRRRGHRRHHRRGPAQNSGEG